MKKAISTAQTASNIARILDLLAETPARLETLSAGLSSDRLRQPQGAGERSLTEDLAHLLNTEARSSEAIYLALLADEPLFVDLHPERQWGKLLRYDQHPFPELLAYFKLRRAVLLQVLSGLASNQWSRAIREAGKQRKESVYWQARSLALHELEHLADLDDKLGS